MHGSEPGPRVSVTAGIHGAEYVSIAALREVALASTRRASGLPRRRPHREPAAFAGRSIYVNPIDGRNLNRAFPGDPAGLPHPAPRALDHGPTVIAGSDAYLDMHCGDMNEALVSFTGIEDTGDAVVDSRSRALADAYGLRYLLIGPSPGTTTTAAATLGIPAVLGEVGGQGRWPAEDVALHAAGFRRWLRAAGVIDERPGHRASRPEVLPTEAWMRASSTGYWHPAVSVGERVTAGPRSGRSRTPSGPCSSARWRPSTGWSSSS